MNDAVAGATVRPYQEQHVLICRRLLDIVAELIRRCYRLAIDLVDHIATRQPRIFRRAARLYLCNRDSLYLRGRFNCWRTSGVRSEIAMPSLA